MRGTRQRRRGSGTHVADQLSLGAAGLTFSGQGRPRAMSAAHPGRGVRAGHRQSEGGDTVATGSSHPEACVVCAGLLVQNSGAGRRRRYCGTACRRRAQRRRQAGRVPVVDQQGPLGRAVAAEVRRLAQQLLDSEMREEELGTLLERAEAIRRELGIYTAAAVQDARHRGEKWESVARAAHVAPETARARWGPERVARMMDLHANEKRAAPARGGQSYAVDREAARAASRPYRWGSVRCVGEEAGDFAVPSLLVGARPRHPGSNRPRDRPVPMRGGPSPGLVKWEGTQRSNPYA